ncbi:hypothetical protein ACG7TL_008204 [Trametes sanguinea]
MALDLAALQRPGARDDVAGYRWGIQGSYTPSSVRRGASLHIEHNEPRSPKAAATIQAINEPITSRDRKTQWSASSTRLSLTPETSRASSTNFAKSDTALKSELSAFCTPESSQSVCAHEHGHGGVHEHAAIVASPYPVSWNVEQTEEGIRISWPNTDLVFDLADWGSKTPGTKIELRHLKPGEPCELWHYTRYALAAEHDSELEVRSSRAVSLPATTETVFVTEECDYITTTTEITKMLRWMLQHTRPKSPNRRTIGYRLA